MPLFLYYLLLCFVHIQQSHSSNNIQSDEYLGSTGKHLFYFVHVTDIHFTQFGHHDRMEQFEQFCNQIIKSLIKPQITIVSGDLTHNRDPGFSSTQYKAEWIMYQDILNRTNVTQHTIWLDIRGNHDAFMDSDPKSNKSYYRIYSQQGVAHEGSYQYTLTTGDNDSYSFVAIDMCPRPGPGRPFNFLGYLSEEELQNVKTLSEQTRHSTTTIFFGHYPLSYTYSRGLNDLMRHGVAYLNGHLHVFFKHLYTRHADGLLELELGDWKESRLFRVITIDGGLLSFGDFHFDEPIYAVISNPKAARFKTPREPLYRLSQSTHIRVIIFSKWPIANVKISIDSKFFGNAKQSIDNQNLYVLPWDPTLYNDNNLHDLSIEIEDLKNNKVKVENQFSVSTETITLMNLPFLVLLIHWPFFGTFCIITALCVYIMILIFFRYRGKRTKRCHGFFFTIWNTVRIRMMLLCSINLFYYSLIGLALYHFIGPWYFGYLTDGHFGAVFLWGMLVKNTYLPPDMQTYMGAIQIVLFLFPLTISLCSSCYYRFVKLQSSINLAESECNKALRIFTVYVMFGGSFVFVLFWSYSITRSYPLAWLTSPFGIALSAFALYLFAKSLLLELRDFKLPIVTSDLDTSTIDTNIELNQYTNVAGRKEGMKDN